MERKSPTVLGSPWIIHDQNLKEKANQLRRKTEKVLIQEEIEVNSNHYFFFFYLPRKVYYITILRPISPYILIPFGVFILLYWLNYFTPCYSIIISSILGISLSIYVSKKMYRKLNPNFWKKLTGFSALNSNKEFVKDEEKLSELLIAGQLETKLYFKPVVRQGETHENPAVKHKEILERAKGVLDGLKQVIEKGKEKLENKPTPKTNLDKKLKELNESLYQSNLKISEYKKRMHDLETEINNLSLKISEDLIIKDEEYINILKKSREIIREYKKIIKERIKIMKDYELVIKEKYDIKLRPSKPCLIKYAIISFVSYFLSKAIKFLPLLRLSWEGFKYIYYYFLGIGALERALNKMEGIESHLEEDIKLVDGFNSKDVEFRY